MAVVNYFAYGSCMNEKDFIRDLKKAHLEKSYKILGVGKLEGFRLAFTRYAFTRGGGVLDMIPSLGDYVLGVVYQVPEKALIKVIDRREGVSGGAYYRDLIEIELNGEKIKAYTYLVKNKLEHEIEPSESYKEIVYEAMKNMNFPEEYINKYLLEHIASLKRNDNDKVSYEAEVYDSSSYLDSMGTYVIGMPKSLRNLLSVDIGDWIYVRYEEKELKLKVYKTDSRLLGNGQAPADNLQFHVCIPRQVRDELGLKELDAFHRKNYPVFKKKFSCVTIYK